MKKRFTFLLALALLAAMLCSCGGAKQNEETTTEPTTTEAPLVWNEELQNKVKQTYLEKFRKQGNGKNVTIEDISIEKHYGIYNNAVVILRHTGILTVTSCENIDGIEIFYSNDGFIEVWKNNTLYRLQEAFDKGFLNHKDLLQIAELHNPEWVQAK